MTTKIRLLHDTVGIPTGAVAVTQSASDNTTKVATTAYVTTALANLADSAPSTLNTLNELAAALGDDANFSTTVTNSIATKLPLAGGTLTGDITLTNDKDIHFLTNSGSNDGTMITRASGDALRIKYATNVLVFDAVDNLATRFYNSNGVSALEILPNATAADSQVKVNNGNFIVNSGRVGIGTGAPSKSLSVKAPSGSNGGIDVFHSNGNKVAELVHSGSGDEGRLSLLDSGSTTVQFMGETGQNSYINSGNVGIGTTGPSGKLHVVGRSKFQASGNDTAITLINQSGGDANLQVLGTSTSAIYRFNTYSTGDALRIEDNGDVLINSAAVKNLGFTTKVQIEGTGATSASQAIIRNSNSIDPPYFIFGKSRGTSNASNTIVQDNDHLGRIRWMGADGNDMASAAAEINAYVDGTPGSNDMPGALTFSTTADGAASSTERMRIHSSGHVSIKGTANASADGLSNLTLGSGSGDAGLSIYSGSTSTSRIMFADGTSGGAQYDGFLAYEHNPQKLGMGVAGTGGYKMVINSSGNVGIGSSNPTIGKLQVHGGGGSSFATLHLQPDTSTTFNHSINAFNSNLTNGENNLIVFGKEGSTKNAAWVGYKWRSAGSDTNQLTFGHWGNNNVFNILGNGHVGIGTESPTHRLDVEITATNTPTARFLNKGSVTGYTNIVAVDTWQSNSVNHQYLVLSSGNGSAVSDNEFNFRGDGQAYADGSWNGGGADYAEYFEWSDGNSSSQDRVGYSVSLVNNKIKIAESGETVIGVISGNPAVVGDNSWNKWKDKYQRDDYGRYIRNSDGHRISNPDYDDTLTYVKREDRKEWDIVGLMGKLRIKKGQQTGTNWIKMRDISASVEEWLVR